MGNQSKFYTLLFSFLSFSLSQDFIPLRKMDRNQDQNAIVGVVASVLAFGAL
ncbi:hypothetical protein V6Z11_A07G166300 [Gossypium hirsutum]